MLDYSWSAVMAILFVTGFLVPALLVLARLNTYSRTVNMFLMVLQIISLGFATLWNLLNITTIAHVVDDHYGTPIALMAITGLACVVLVFQFRHYRQESRKRPLY